MIEVTVIIPAFNAEHTLCRCLDSILNQAVELEVIVIDDCSTDDTAAVCERYAQRDKRVRFLRNAENIGQGLSRNRGIELAQGAFLAFVDSDDYVAPHMYEDLIALAHEGDAAIDVVGCNLLYPAPHDPIDGAPRLTDVKRYDRAHIQEQVLPGFIGNMPANAKKPRALPISSCTYLFRTSVVRAHGVQFLSERRVYSEDLFFDYDVLQHAEGFAFTTSPYYCYTVNAGSTTHHFHHPSSKIERLFMLAGTDENLRLRARLTAINSLVDSALQLCTDPAYSLREKCGILAEISDNPFVQEALATYPLQTVSIRGRLFFACCTHARAPLALAMAYAHYYLCVRPQQELSRIFNKFVRARARRGQAAGIGQGAGGSPAPGTSQAQEGSTKVRP